MLTPAPRPGDAGECGRRRPSRAYTRGNFRVVSLLCDDSLSMEFADNSIETALSPVVGRPFAPGMSGNPGGRPKGFARYVRELVGDDGRRIADFMFGVMEDERERTEVRMEATRWLADRGFGRSHVPVDVKQSEANVAT